MAITGRRGSGRRIRVHAVVKTKKKKGCHLGFVGVGWEDAAQIQNSLKK